MDEPTNDLDADTLELLEEMLMEYEGTVLLVSHDREFLNNIVTSTIVFEGGGRLKEYVGGYDDWVRQRKPAAPSQTENAAKTKKPRPRQERPRILTFNEKKELEALPVLIESLEAERNALFEILASPEFYQQEGSRVSETKTRLRELEKEVTESYDRWELLESILNSQPA
jgi:ATP-binding cassette subfamily F protein uup